MAINKIENSAYLDSDWQNEIITKNLMKKGFNNLDVELSGSTLTIKSGSYVDFSGTIYKIDADITLTAAVGSYVVFTYDATTPTITVESSTLPEYDFNLEGYYNGTERFLYYFPTDTVVEDLEKSRKIYYNISDKSSYLFYDEILFPPLLWENTSATNIIDSISINIDNNKVYTVSQDKYLRKIDASTGVVDWSLLFSNIVISLEIKSDASKLYVGDVAGNIMQVDESTHTIDWTSSFAGAPIANIDINSSDTKLYVGSFDNKVMKIDISARTIDWTNSDHSNSVFRVAVNSDETKVYSGSYDDTIKQIDASTGVADWTYSSFTSDIKGLVLDDAGDKLYACSIDQTIKKIDISTQNTDFSFTSATEQEFLGITLDEEKSKVIAIYNNLLATGKSGILIIDSNTFEEVFTIAHPQYILSPKAILLDATNKFIYIGGADNTLKKLQINYIKDFNKKLP